MTPKILLGMASIIFALLFIFLEVAGHTITAKNSSEASDLSESELHRFEKEALQDRNQKSAGRVYWYFRLTKRDAAQTEKWDAIVNSLDTNEFSGATNTVK